MCATAAVCGSTGSTSLGGEIKEWNLNLNEDIPEVTSMSSGGFKEFLPCLRDADGDFESFTSIGAIGARASVDFVNDKYTYTMDIIITDVTLTDAVEDAIRFKYTFVSTGAISRA